MWRCLLLDESLRLLLERYERRISSSILGVGDFVRLSFVAVDYFDADSTSDLDLDLDLVTFDGEEDDGMISFLSS